MGLSGMRLFVAVRLASELQKAIGAFIAQNAAKTKGVKWIDVGQAHFTLFFLGEQPAELVAEIDPLLQKTATEQRSFQLSLGPGGVFPSWKAPRVLWLGVEKGREELKSFGGRGNGSMRGKGGSAPRARLHPSSHPRTREKTTGSDRPGSISPGVEGEMEVAAFTLFASELRPQGPLYRELATYPLGQVKN